MQCHVLLCVGAMPALSASSSLASTAHGVGVASQPSLGRDREELTAEVDVHDAERHNVWTVEFRKGVPFTPRGLQASQVVELNLSGQVGFCQQPPAISARCPRTLCWLAAAHCRPHACATGSNRHFWTGGPAAVVHVGGQGGCSWPLRHAAAHHTCPAPRPCCSSTSCLRCRISP